MEQILFSFAWGGIALGLAALFSLVVGKSFDPEKHIDDFLRIQPTKNLR